MNMEMITPNDPLLELENAVRHIKHRIHRFNAVVDACGGTNFGTVAFHGDQLKDSIISFVMKCADESILNARLEWNDEIVTIRKLINLIANILTKIEEDTSFKFVREYDSENDYL